MNLASHSLMTTYSGDRRLGIQTALALYIHTYIQYTYNVHRCHSSKYDPLKNVAATSINLIYLHTNLPTYQPTYLVERTTAAAAAGGGAIPAAAAAAAG